MEKHSRINWDEYFMEIAETVAKRSLDPDSQFGCVAVSEDHTILSVGYNGPPRGVNDSEIPLTRPEKYPFMEHSERNCIYNAAREGISLKGCTFYVTGTPCTDCLRAMHQVGCHYIIYKDKKPNSFDDSWTIVRDFISKYVGIFEYQRS